MLSIWASNNISHIQDELFTFSQPDPQNWDGKVSETVSTMVTHPDQSNHQGNQKHMLGLAVPFANLSILCKKKYWTETMLLSQTGMFWLFFVQNLLYLSTGGVIRASPAVLTAH